MNDKKAKRMAKSVKEVSTWSKIIKYKSINNHTSAPTHYTTIDSYSASRNNWCTVGGDGGCRVSEARAGATSPMPNHRGFKLQ